MSVVWPGLTDDLRGPHRCDRSLNKIKIVQHLFNGCYVCNRIVSVVLCIAPLYVNAAFFVLVQSWAAQKIVIFGTAVGCGSSASAHTPSTNEQGRRGTQRHSSFVDAGLSLSQNAAYEQRGLFIVVMLGCRLYYRQGWEQYFIDVAR